MHLLYMIYVLLVVIILLFDNLTSGVRLTGMETGEIKPNEKREKYNG
jgi:hypothetical protein